MYSTQGPASTHVRRSVGVMCLLVLALAVPRSSSPATLHVPADQPTIRAAVAAADSGDLILIAPGSHQGGAFVDGKAITIASWYLSTGDTAYIAQTVLDGVVPNVCGGAPGCLGNAVLEYGSDADGNDIIGLTIANGENGVASASTVNITSCRVLGNGDGVDFVPGSGGTFRNSLFANNRDDGIDLNGRMQMQIIDNIIRDNADDGIEFRLFAHAGAVMNVGISGNRITGNGEDGIQLIDYPAVSNYVIRIERNLFAANFNASGLSAAIGCMPDGQTVESLVGAPIVERVYVINNTFVGEQNGLVGGANVIALNNIFTAIQGSAIRRVAGASIASYTLLWNNGIDHEESVVDPPHLLFADPRLDAAGELLAGSPAIDAGTLFFQWQGEIVLDLPFEDPMDLGAFQFVGNLAPMVDAGPDQVVTLPSAARLTGVVSDDGKPVPGGALTFLWSLSGGPGPVTLETPTAPSTRALFTAEGVYRFRLTASDGELVSTDSMQVTVQIIPVISEHRVAQASDDAEESAGGNISGNVSDLELVYSGNNQIVGLRFPNVTVPQGVTVAQAYIQFEADEVQSEPTHLLLEGQAADDPNTFTVQPGNISSRPRTAAAASWSPPPWTVVGESGTAQRTSDLTAVVQEIVDRPGWSSGNAIVIIISGSGHRTARSFEGEAAGAPLLHIEIIAAAAGVEDGPPSTLELRPVGGNPTSRAVLVEFALPHGRPATLELIDVTGRRLAARDAGSLGPGRHRVELRRDLPIGVYFVRLSQDRHSKRIKVAVLE